MSSAETIKGLNPIVGDEKSKVEKRVNPVQYYIKFSFSITYIFLLTTATITFIEAMRTKISKVRHVLNLETAISIIAVYFYSVFLEKITVYEKEDRKIDWSDISLTRYIDWAMTTPLMLLALLLVLSQNIGKSITFRMYMGIIALNFIMLYSGYLGETNTINRLLACGIGFVAFSAMFYIIYKEFILSVSNFPNKILFSIFSSIWAFYGVFYMMSEDYKNIGMNILDCLAKCCFGLGLWAYYSKLLVLA